MKEISPDRLYHGLLAHGLFSEKLPPIFTSVNFFDYCQSLQYNFEERWSTYIYFDNMRDINIPRQMGIPNPMAYQQLCKCLSNNWLNICEHFEKFTSNQTHKISRIHIRRLKKKPALFEMNYNNWKIDGSPEPDLIMGKRYMVTADIATFFPSIYTHSIPWALAEKSIAKSTAKNRNLWYNVLDRYTQYIKHGETHGLIIGPHASNLLSEIILTVIDYNLYEKGWHNYIRHVDDFSCYVDSYEQGQQFILDLLEELHFFDLKLNDKKTSIEKLPLAAVEQWIRQIKAIKTIADDKTMRFPDVMAYLDNVIEIMQHNNGKTSILNYAIKVLSSQKMTRNAKEYCTKTILHYAILFPYLIPLMDEYVFKAYNVDVNLINKFANRIYEDGIQFRNYEEVYFSLFFAKKYNFCISSADVDKLLKTNNCILFLLSYLYYENIKDRDARKKLKNCAMKLSMNDDDFGQNWVFIYEVLPKSSLRGEWKNMKEKQVTFLKPF
jgi:hypothetical protein